MIVVYIAGKYRGANAWEVAQHIREAESLAFAVAKLGAMPLCPHTNTAHFDGTLTAEFWLEGTLELMVRCDAVVLVHNWLESSGARAEAERALVLGMPVFFGPKALERWLESRVSIDAENVWVQSALRQYELKHGEVG